MPTYKLATTNRWHCMELLQSRYQDVDPATHVGMDRALTLAIGSADVHKWVSRILDAAADAPGSEVPGLIETLRVLLSVEERPAAELIDERRGR